MKHLLVTNDFPPKIGGIQSYLWELWRRLPAEEAVVLTTPYEGSQAFDAASPIRIERIKSPVMLPTDKLRREVLDLASEVDADLIIFDPALPVGHLANVLGRPYGVILHGAEITVPGRVPGPRRALARVLAGAQVVIAAGGYPADEGERAVGRGLPVVVIPPGVDVDRFQPISTAAKQDVRRRFGVAADAPLVVSVSRLVPRKGFDVLIEASARLEKRHPGLQVLIGGSGRDARRLQRLIDSTGAPARLLGRVEDQDLPELYAAADVFSMTCRNRWLGLEQEGFGIVFLEAAATGVPQIAGHSGGAAEAVVDAKTGLVVRDPRSVEETITAIDTLLSDPELRRQMGEAGRERAVREFCYDVLAEKLRDGLNKVGRP